MEKSSRNILQNMCFNNMRESKWWLFSLFWDCGFMHHTLCVRNNLHWRHCLIFPSSPAESQKMFQRVLFSFHADCRTVPEQTHKACRCGASVCVYVWVSGYCEMQTWSSRPSKPRLCGKCWQSCVLHSLYPFSSSLQCTHSGNHWIIDVETGNPFLP